MVLNTEFQNTWKHAMALFCCHRLRPERRQFPDDVMFEVFVRLPVKSLLRFRCVSKSIRAMIDSQDFIKEHAHRSLATKSDFQLIFTHKSPPQDYVYLGNGIIFWPEQQQPDCVDLGNGNSAAKPRVLKHPFYPNTLVIVGCYNGIICLRDDSIVPEGYTLWNPSTRKYKKIESLPHLLGDIHSTDDRVISGFGYDHVKDDYKIIRMDMIEDCPGDMQVYSLKSNSWRILDIQLPDGYYEEFISNAFVQGAVHWLRKGPFDEWDIAAFHLGSETFRLLPLPPPRAPHRHIRNPALIELEDNLCVIDGVYHPAASLATLTICVMEEYGNKDSWRTYDMDIRYPFSHPNPNFTFPFFPVSRRKSVAHDEQVPEWFLIDIQQLKGITSPIVQLRYSNWDYEGHKLFLCCKTLVQL